MLEFKNISFTYKQDTAPVLDDISFHIEKGSFVSLIGASGTGKSTIFRLINGFEAADCGQISKQGRTAYMPQSDALFPWRNAWQNVSLPMQVGHISKSERKKKAYEMLDKVGLRAYAKKYPRELSGGMRQRVSFARTLCAGGELLLLDEPFSALDSITRIELQEWLREQRMSFDKTIFFITHDVDEAIFLSDKILVLQGKPVNSVLEYSVPLGKIRSRDMLSEQSVQSLKTELISLLRSEAMG